MTKKIFVAMILAFVLIVAGGQSKVDAAEFFVGHYSDGTAVYLLPHTIRVQSNNPYRFTCTVRARHDYLDYSFYSSGGSPYYSNSEGFHGYVFNSGSPVAENIYRYVVEHY